MEGRTRVRSFVWASDCPQCASRVFHTCNTRWAPLRLSNKTMATANTTKAIWCKWNRVIPIFCWISKKQYFFGVPQNSGNQCVCHGRRKAGRAQSCTGGVPFQGPLTAHPRGALTEGDPHHTAQQQHLQT